MYIFLTRSTARAGLLALALLQGESVASVVAPHSASFVDCAKLPLQSLPLAVQAGQIDALAYFIALRPPLPGPSALARIIRIVCQQLETPDELAPPNRVTPTSRAPLSSALRAASLRLLAATLSRHDVEQLIEPELQRSVALALMRGLAPTATRLGDGATSRIAAHCLARLSALHVLPKDTIQACLKPLLVAVAGKANQLLVTAPMLRSLGVALRLFAHTTNSAALGDRVYEHLMRWAQATEATSTQPATPTSAVATNATATTATSSTTTSTTSMNAAQQQQQQQQQPPQQQQSVSQTMSLSLSEEAVLAAAAYDLYHLLPGKCERFVAPLVRHALSRPHLLLRRGADSVRSSLLALLNRCPDDAVAFFLEQPSPSLTLSSSSLQVAAPVSPALSAAMQQLFVALIDEPAAAELRGVLQRNVALLAASMSMAARGTLTDDDSSSSSTGDALEGAHPVVGTALIRAIVQHEPLWLSAQPDVLRILLARWRAPARRLVC